MADHLAILPQHGIGYEDLLPSKQALDCEDLKHACFGCGTPNTLRRSPPTTLLAVPAVGGLVVLAVALQGQSAQSQQATADELKVKTANLQTDGPSLLQFLKSRTLSEAERERVDVLIAQLGAKSFKIREETAQELIAKGPAVLASLQQGLNFPDQEVQLRCASCIKEIKKGDRFAEVSGAVVA